MILGALLYGGFGIHDLYPLSLHFQTAGLIRLLFVVLLFVIMFLMTFLKRISFPFLIGVVVSYNTAVLGLDGLTYLSWSEFFGYDLLMVSLVTICTCFKKSIKSLAAENHKRSLSMAEDILTVRRELKESNALKNKLLSVISHDIRGPLTSIQGILYLYHNGYITGDEVKMHSEKLAESIDGLFRLLELEDKVTHDQHR